ncbi:MULTISPECIES: hypothetical protein [Brevibacillus]|jgi:hypothetical protein|uniref:Uncharacterized protein n=1 Tax=Brevibacillus parabrevis TaxID=54914 RepID=A0A4Y3PEM9_BREPA|nr:MULTISPECIES: hypothetical protein [Brevibacillus]TGV00204.1 hypothetical protein EN829_057900 [Mesorhizobium sp. M00.F.Ca.ET.186.01.1.1]KZE46862.1 hypothetical protein AV540_21360 [Brevibacillus parabrevis]MBU8714815.1 hypothetical protein [Brevibacillus parabrevis]MDH6348778.1 hypothetical protein [Brevibacillus sp. 1238]MDR5000673.1 hypothetical protein [Brevibacillus parabrevis]
MSTMPRGSYKDQFHQRLYVQLNQGHNKLNYQQINKIQEQMQSGVDEYAHMQHDVSDTLGMNKH